MPLFSSGYVEIVSTVTTCRFELTFLDRCRIGLTFFPLCDVDVDRLRRIGKFTRENVALWLSRCTGCVMEFGPRDLHAVWGTTEIAWATKEGFEVYHRNVHGRWHGGLSEDGYNQHA